MAHTETFHSPSNQKSLAIAKARMAEEQRIPEKIREEHEMEKLRAMFRRHTRTDYASETLKSENGSRELLVGSSNDSREAPEDDALATAVHTGIPSTHSPPPARSGKKLWGVAQKKLGTAMAFKHNARSKKRQEKRAWNAPSSTRRQSADIERLNKWIPETDSAKARQEFQMLNMVWKAEVNEQLTEEMLQREKERALHAANMVYDKGTVDCHGVTTVARGLGELLLAKVCNPNFEPDLSEDHLKNMKLKNVVERRQGRDLNFHKKAWDDKVTSLFETPAEEMVKKKLMYEERRKFIRGTLEMQRRRKKAKAAYVPVKLSSIHAISLGTPEEKRKEFDDRRAFLRSNLTDEERRMIGKSLRVEERYM